MLPVKSNLNGSLVSLLNKSDPSITQQNLSPKFLNKSSAKILQAGFGSLKYDLFYPAFIKIYFREALSKSWFFRPV